MICTIRLFVCIYMCMLVCFCFCIVALPQINTCLSVCSAAMANHGTSRNVRPRLEAPDPLMVMLCGDEAGDSWMHVVNNPELYHTTLAKPSSPPPSQLQQSDASSDEDDDIDNCSCPKRCPKSVKKTIQLSSQTRNLKKKTSKTRRRPIMYNV